MFEITSDQMLATIRAQAGQIAELTLIREAAFAEIRRLAAIVEAQKPAEDAPEPPKKK